MLHHYHSSVIIPHYIQNAAAAAPTPINKALPGIFFIALFVSWAGGLAVGDELAAEVLLAWEIVAVAVRSNFSNPAVITRGSDLIFVPDMAYVVVTGAGVNEGSLHHSAGASLWGE